MTTHDLTPAQARQALQTVRDALDIPYPATAGDDKIRHAILEHRIRYAVLYLGRLLDGPALGPDWELEYLRERLAEHPAAGYRTCQQAAAERAPEEAGQ